MLAARKVAKSLPGPRLLPATRKSEEFFTRRLMKMPSAIRKTE
jgi:hypothetical protein